MKCELKNGNLIITIPVNAKPTACQIEGKPVIVGVNAYVRN